MTQAEIDKKQSSRQRKPVKRLIDDYFTKNAEAEAQSLYIVEDPLPVDQSEEQEYIPVVKPIHPFFDLKSKRRKTESEFKDLPSPVDLELKLIENQDRLRQEIQDSKQLNAKFFSNKPINPFFQNIKVPKKPTNEFEPLVVEPVQLLEAPYPDSSFCHVNASRSNEPKKEFPYIKMDFNLDIKWVKVNSNPSSCTDSSKLDLHQVSSEQDSNKYPSFIRKQLLSDEFEDVFSSKEKHEVFSKMEKWLLDYLTGSWQIKKPDTKKKRPDEWDDFIDDNFSDEESQGKAMLLCGPCGSGKTWLIDKLVKKLDFRVLEVNSGQKRSHKDIQLLFGDSLQSRILKNNQPDSNQRLLFLVEDADIVYEEDKGFWNAVETLIFHSRVPVLITSTEFPLTSFNQSITPLLCQKLQNVTECLYLEFPTSLELASMSHIFLSQFGLDCSFDQLNSLIAKEFKDLRSCLNWLQNVISTKSITPNAKQQEISFDPETKSIIDLLSAKLEFQNLESFTEDSCILYPYLTDDCVNSYSYYLDKRTTRLDYIEWLSDSNSKETVDMTDRIGNLCYLYPPQELFRKRTLNCDTIPYIVNMLCESQGRRRKLVCGLAEYELTQEQRQNLIDTSLN